MVVMFGLWLSSTTTACSQLAETIGGSYKDCVRSVHLRLRSLVKRICETVRNGSRELRVVFWNRIGLLQEL